jgi:hypothetical protein
VPDDITELTVDVWEEGEIATNAEDWYSFEATSGTTYYLWLNENGANGNYLKTGNVSVSAWYLDGTVLLNNVTTAWATAASFSATSTDTVYVRVTAASGGAGTYGIVYKESNTRPIAPFNVTAIPLAEIEWKDGNLTASNSVDWYSIEVTNGTTYNLWWNESGGSNGDGSKTGNIRVVVVSDNGTVIIAEKESSWYDASPFTAAYDGTVYVKVISSGGFNSTGTYGIVYSTKSSRPLILPANITPLVADQWANGNIVRDGVDWYSISVTNGTYRLWWNENEDVGNGTKTGNVTVSAWYSDGTITTINNVNTSWGEIIASFTASSTDIVYIKVTPTTPSSGGTYGIAYSTGTTRPAAPIVDVTATPLVNQTWANGNITVQDGIDWYSIQVTNGTTYRLWLNASNGDDDSKTGDVWVSVWYSDGTLTSIYRQNDAWTNPVSFTSNSTGTVYVKVEALNINVGSYGIVYSTGDTRPEITP